MTTRQPIAEGLISCRNILLGGRTNEHVLPCLQKVLVDLDSIAVSSTRKIVERCAAEAIDQIKDGDFVSAGRILNLVHNLPLDEASEQRWDIDYFLSMELPTFLEHFEEIKSARLIALYVCKQLAYQYVPD
ncbi:hypothetical protein [Pelomonas sp. BJYL3]|uniref:hypothetical protein n=1 Tax=Pelomonas sp. BJYL3 TaxID=2976697 RepID=UPI0022B4C835|nr:hypothetical protein [Pelomonas sp. BJYL3]